MDFQFIATPSLDFLVALNLGETASLATVRRLRNEQLFAHHFISFTFYFSKDSLLRMRKAEEESAFNTLMNKMVPNTPSRSSKERVLLLR